MYSSAPRTIPLREHWGTIRDAYEIEFLIEEDYLRYEFTTAWSPPFPIYHKLIETFPQLTFDIISYDLINNWAYELEAKNGYYTKIIEETMEPLTNHPLQPDSFSVVRMLCYRKDILSKKLNVTIKDVNDLHGSLDTNTSESEKIEIENYSAVEGDLLKELDNM